MLRSNVAPQLAARVLQQRAAMIGERKRVTVLIADIRGSTALIDDMDPEEAMATIGPIMKILMDAVHAHEGFVNQTRGDGIMALFGAPLANENHAVDACAAALEMRDAVASLARRSGKAHALRVGINSGEVIIQSIGSDFSMNYDAVGRTVHLAAGLEKIARPDAILLSEETARLAEGFVDVRRAGSAALKGVAQAVNIFELIGARSVTRWQVRKAQGLLPLRGREEEKAVLASALAAAENGNGGLVMITAPPGLGKSRLVEDLIESLPAAWDALHAVCSAQRAATSYHPIAQLMHKLLGITAQTSPDSVRERLSENLARNSSPLEAYIPAFLSLLDVRAPDSAWNKLDPGQRRIKVSEAVRAGVALRASRRPVLAIIEDAHWCDSETRNILESIAGAVSAMRVLLVVTQRPEQALRFPSAVPVTRLDLAPLDRSSALALAQGMLGSDISLAPITQRILDLAGGNPLFIEELIQDLKHRNILRGDAGNHRLSGATGDVRMPDSIHSVIAARIDQLDAELRAILQTAAVIGQRVPVALLAHMLGRTSQSLAAPLMRLELAGFLFAAEGGTASVFKHELIRDVAYHTLLIGTRQRMHAKAMEYIETNYSDRLEEHVDRLAHHAFEAQLWEKALPYLVRSCRRALRRGANHEAISLCEQAAATLRHLPPGEERAKAEVDFALAEIIALEPLGRHRRIASLMRDASRVAEGLGDAWRTAAVNCQLVVALWRIGEHAAAMEAADTAEAAAAQVDDAALIFAARHNRGIVHHEKGEFAEAISALRDCISMETPEIEEKRVGWAALPSVVLRTFLADSLLQIGEIAEAETLAVEAAARAEEAGHIYSRVQINQVLAHIRIMQGRSGEALALLTEDWRVCVELGMLQMQPIIATRIGQAHLARGNIQAAIEILAQPDRVDVPLIENAFGWRYLFLTRGRAFLAAGRPTDARICAERVLAMANLRGERPQEACAHVLLADVARAHNQYGNARRHLLAALQLSEACGMVPIAQTCRAALAAQPSGLLSRFVSAASGIGQQARYPRRLLPRALKK